MYKMISWWARNPKAANLLMAGIIIVGIATFSRIEQEVSPELDSKDGGWNSFPVYSPTRR